MICFYNLNFVFLYKSLLKILENFRKKFFGTLNSPEIYPLYEIRFWNCNPVWKNSPYGIFYENYFFYLNYDFYYLGRYFLLFNFLVFLFFKSYIFLLIKRGAWKSWKFPEKIFGSNCAPCFWKKPPWDWVRGITPPPYPYNTPLNCFILTIIYKYDKSII